MSFQLIHTSSPHLLDSTASGYGTVARSADMPAALYQQLPAFSSLKESAGRIQFSYRILTAHGENWHTLSCIQQAGADYSGRACHTAHHLLFSQQEVMHLLNLPQRPTPAGICLMLLRSGFWVASWQKEPELLHSEPTLSMERLPDATVQPTWKKYTGHKANARAFYTPPYHQECVIVTPAAMQQEDILALLHESDWLSHTRGWGATFTTAADETDNFSDTLRFIVSQGSPLIQRAQRTGHPVIRINEELELPVAPPPSVALVPDAAKSEAANIVHTLARSTASYHYTEEPDWALFDIPLPPSPYKKPLLAGIAGIGSCAVLAIWCANSFTDTQDTPPVLPAIIDVEQSPITQLNELLVEPYNHEATAHLMQDLCMLKGKSAEETWLAECANLIRKAGTAEVNHADAIKRICECARLLGVLDTDLVRLYLREATYSSTAEDWLKRFDAISVEEWLKLQLSEPAVEQIFASDELKAFSPRNVEIQQEPTPLLATADSTPPPPVDVVQAPRPGRVSLIPHPARCGETLPRPLAKALTELPLTISTGRYIVSILQTGNSLQPSQQLELSEEGYRLHLTATENNGEYRLTPIHKEKKPTDLPETIIRVHNGKLRSVRCGQGSAVLSFPVPQEEDFYTNIILAPEFGIPIPFGKATSLPDAHTLNFRITPDDIRISGTPAKPKLLLSEKRKKSEFPWKADKKMREKHHFTIALPFLHTHNSISVTQDSLSRLSCQKTSLTSETSQLTSILCQIEHKPALPQRLEATFTRIANTPCCGRDNVPKGTPSLAELYYIISALGDKKLSLTARRQLHNAYFQLLTSPHFNKELRAILPTLQVIMLKPADATGTSLHCRRLRSTICDELDKPGIQESILTGICQMLSRSALAAYEQEKQDFEKNRLNRPALMLLNISQGGHGELLWHFHIKDTK